MSFTSIIFTSFFLPALLICYFAIPSKFLNAKNAILLAFSLFFYSWGGLGYLFLLLGSVLLNYLSGLAAGMIKSKGLKKAALIISVVLNLCLLGVFKYLNFVTSSLAQWGLGVTVTSIVLPIGISFYTFQGLSYVFDVYRGDAECAKNPVTVALYISLFPQLVAGPIVRYSDIESELYSRSVSFSGFASGAVRFMLGFGKKMILANSVGAIADSVFSGSTSGAMSAPLAWLGAVAFTFQIYFDFSSYSDMAIGLGKMFGFHFNENFNYPYVSTSVTDFWRRWHISLSTWFRDYVYIPLGGNRRSLPRRIFNLSVVWALTGLWHGANWTFILWGVYNGVLLIFEKFVIGKRLEKIPAVIRGIVTMFLVIIGWVLFRSDSISSAWTYLGTMFGIGAGTDVSEFVYLVSQNWIVLVLSVIASLPLKSLIRPKIESSRKLATAAGVVLFVFSVAVFAFSYMKLVSGSFMPFIYFQF